MPVNHGIWKMGQTVCKVNEVKMDSEEALEEIIQKSPEILNESWLIIGRQVLTAYNQYIDLLALDSSGSIIIIELKKHKTPRDVVAQSIDYASWVKELNRANIYGIYKDFNQKYMKSEKSLDTFFKDKFGFAIEDESLNSSHQIVIVAAELDSSTERIVKYLSDSAVPINAVFFKVFEDSGQRYLSRAWIIDPVETSDIAVASKSYGEWNGEFYVSFGHGQERNWEDAAEYSFISGGGGQWYSRTLNLLSIGDRIWVNIPKVGYVGVGRVVDTAKRADEVFFRDGDQEKTIYALSKKANYHSQYREDDDNAEYIVKVKWEQQLTQKQAISETGFFGNQNTVCKPTTSKWVTTVNRLKDLWKIEV